jgi:DNA-binding response OmpR family regulator
MPIQDRFSILLVDDDALVIRLLGRMLTEFTPLRFATSGHAAVRLAVESVPDLVLLDVEMPAFSGFEICKAFKAVSILAQVPIIFISSYDSPQLRAQGAKLGAADFISKPPDTALLRSRVRALWRTRSQPHPLPGAETVDPVRELP